MKTNVAILKVKQRNKAFKHTNLNNPIKTIPKPLVELILKLGFIDVRSEKQTLTSEERLLLVLYDKTEKYKDVPNFKKGLDNIVIIKKQFVKTINDSYYSVLLKDAPEVRIKESEYNKLEIEEEEVHRWA